MALGTALAEALATFAAWRASLALSLIKTKSRCDEATPARWCCDNTSMPQCGKVGRRVAAEQHHARHRDDGAAAATATTRSPGRCASMQMK